MPQAQKYKTFAELKAAQHQNLQQRMLLQAFAESGFNYWDYRDVDNALFFWQLGWKIGINWRS